MRRTRRDRSNTGFTLTEVLASVVLMAIALVPVLKAHIAAQVLGTKAERMTPGLSFAVKKMEEIHAAALTSFSTDFSTSSEVISTGYLCTVQDGQESATLKSIKVLVGYDIDGDSFLDSEEVDVVLNTQIANTQ